MKTILPLDSGIIKLGRDALEQGLQAAQGSAIRGLSSITRKQPSINLKGTSYIDQEYNTTVFLLSNVYYKNITLKLSRIGTNQEFFESSPLLGRWYSFFETLVSNPSTELAYGVLPNGLGLISTGPSYNRSLKVYGKINNVIADVFKKPVIFDSYPIYNKGFVVRYHFIPPKPLTQKIYAIDISLDWSDLRDAFIRQVEDQSFQDVKSIVSGDEYIEIQKSKGYYGD